MARLDDPCAARPGRCCRRAVVAGRCRAAHAIRPERSGRSGRTDPALGAIESRTNQWRVAVRVHGVSAMTRDSSKRLVAVVTSMVLMAFIAGASAGVVGDRVLAPRVTVRATLGDMAGVLDRLDLTPEQRRQADSIVLHSEPRSREVLIELGERLQRVADSVDNELRAILTPRQRLRLDSLRTDSRLVLKRKVLTPTGARVDTLLDTGSTRPRQ